MSCRCLYVLFALSATLWLSHAVCCQSLIGVRGTVADSDGAPVAGLAITLVPSNGGAILHTSTSSHGQFGFQVATAADYDLVTAAAKGFASQTIHIQARPSMSALEIVVTPERVNQSVDVDSGSTISTDADNNQDAVAIDSASLQHLPVFDQDFVSTLSPFLDPAATSTSGVSIVVDGVELKGSTVTPSAIAEVRINSDPYSAEFASPGRGRLEIITKPGSPQFHGDLNFIARDAAFNATNYFATQRPPEQRFIYEGSLTGPLGHDGQTTFLISGTRRQQDIEAVVYAEGPQGIIQANVPTPNRNYQMTGRVTHDFSPQYRLAVGYNFEYGTYVNRGVGGLVLAEAGYDTASREDDLIFNDRLILSPHLIHQLQIVLEKDEEVYRSVTQTPSIIVQSTFTGGGAQADTARTENTIHITEVTSWTHICSDLKQKPHAKVGFCGVHNP